MWKKKTRKHGVEISAMSYFKEFGSIASATVKYGDIRLNNITVCLNDEGRVEVVFPREITCSEAPLYTFSKKEGHSRDCEQIERALAQTFGKLLHGRRDCTVEGIPIEGISIPAGSSPKILIMPGGDGIDPRGNEYKVGPSFSAVYHNLEIANIEVVGPNDSKKLSFPGRNGDVVSPHTSHFSKAIMTAYAMYQATQELEATPTATEIEEPAVGPSF